MHLCVLLSMIWATSTFVVDKDDHMNSTQLYSHTNMVVAGKHATIINKYGKSVDVRPFSRDCSKLEAVPIVDSIIAYEYPYSMNAYFLVMSNFLYVPSIQNNLILSFVMREVGLIINDVPKIHVHSEDLNKESHGIFSREVDGNIVLRIPLKLDVIFSYFLTRKLTEDEVDNCDYI